jgi:Uma2 family endonuclease
MVAFGPGKGDSPEARLCQRGSYQQWKEHNIAPQVVFEILSPSNFAPEMEEKRKFYETHGVEEYYSFNPSVPNNNGPIAQEQQQRAQEQQQRAEQEQQRADRAESEIRQMADQMRLVVTHLLRSGMVVEQVATIVGLPIEPIVEIQREL